MTFMEVRTAETRAAELQLLGVAPEMEKFGLYCDE
jgi:hypothetical protein